MADREEHRDVYKRIAIRHAVDGSRAKQRGDIVTSDNDKRTAASFMGKVQEINKEIEKKKGKKKQPP